MEFVAAGGASVLVGGISTVTVRWEAGPDEAADGVGNGKGDPGEEAVDPDIGGVGNGNGDAGEKPELANWLFCVSICPIMVLKACCMAYF